MNTPRTLKKIHASHYHLMADLSTYSPLPNAQLNQIDPFLLLNHHGFQTYKPNNQGLPFGPHPHRGMQTVTFIVEGDIMHQDSEGYQSIIKAGGIQWMVAGSGLIHAEISSEEFKQIGGDLEILQLWLNLPAKLKMTSPQYKGLQKEEIPTIELNEKAQLQLIAGEYEGKKGAIEPLTDIFLSTLQITEGGHWQTQVPEEKNIFCYAIRGSVEINNVLLPHRHLAEFNNEGETITFKAQQNALLIWGFATPYREPVVARGPFVMNTEKEIYEAYVDYQNGKFGQWTH